MDGLAEVGRVAPARLRPSSALLLAALVAARPGIASMEMLVAALESRRTSGRDASRAEVVKVNIHRLRLEIGYSNISTVWGLGYRLALDFDATPWLEAPP